MNLQIDSLSAVLTGIVPPDSPRLERFTLESGPASLATEPLGLKVARPAKAKVIVTNRDLAAFLSLKAGSLLSDPQLEIGGGAIHLTAKAKIAFLELPVAAVLTLEIVQRTQLHVAVQSVSVAGGGAKSLLEGFIAKNNPIIDTAKLFFPVSLTRVVLEDSVVALEGEALPPA